MPKPSEYRVVAANPATASENRIHSDEVARRHGFRGGLVPGVTVYGYCIPALADAFGEEWIERGGAALRFRQPCYDGDQIAVTVQPAPDQAEVQVTVGATVCVTGQAWLAEASHRVDHPAVGHAALPTRDKRPPAGVDSLVPETVLGTVPLATDIGALASYLQKIAEPSERYRARGLVHPGLLLEAANWVLSANVVLPPWLHVGTEVEHRRAVAVDEPLEVRGRVAGEWERRGHRFVALEVDWVAGVDVVARARHTAIWQLASGEQP